GPRLIDGESTVRFAAAHEKALRQRDIVCKCHGAIGKHLTDQAAERRLDTLSRVPRKYDMGMNRVISGILTRNSHEVRLRAQLLRRHSGIEKRVGTTGGVRRI